MLGVRDLCARHALDAVAGGLEWLVFAARAVVVSALPRIGCLCGRSSAACMTAACVSGLEWSAMAQRERAQVDRERAKLHRLGGLAATPLLPSLQTAQPRGQNAPTRRAGATGRRGRPQWMQQQSQALGEGAAHS